MVELNNVSFRYRDTDDELDLIDVSLRVPDGQVVVLCGESGCGKTTITRLVNGLIPQYHEGDLWGEVLVGGNDVSVDPISATARFVGSVFQNPRSQFFNVDVRSEVAFGCENLGWPVADIDRAVEHTAGLFGIEPFMDRSLFKLSGGEKQKIACASVSASDPQVYVLDEPASNLDMVAIHMLADIIEMWKDQGKTVIVAEHRLSYLMDVADRFVFMRDGRIEWDKPASEMRAMDADQMHAWGLRGTKTQCQAVATPTSHPGLCVRDLFFSYGPSGTRASSDAADVDEPSDEESKACGIAIEAVDIPTGAIVGVMGRNGAGKSTLARCLCGLENKARGTVCIEGVVCKPTARRRECYLVMQDVNHQLFAESVFEEVALSLRMGSKIRKGSEEEERSVHDILESLDLSALQDLHPMALSGGQKQRVAIASAVASDSRVMVFDEPTSGLDWRHMLETASNLRGLSQRGVTSMVITHDPDLIAECCDWVIYVDHGSIAWSGPLDEDKAKRVEEFFA